MTLLISLLSLVACSPKYPDYDPDLDPSDTDLYDTGTLVIESHQCEYTVTTVAPEDDVGLGFTAAESIAALSGERSSFLEWIYWGRRTALTMRFDFSEVEVLLYQSADEVCLDYMVLEAAAEIDSQDNWLVEYVDVSVELFSVDHAEWQGFLPWEEILGDYELSPQWSLEGLTTPQLSFFGETGADGEQGGMFFVGRNENNNPYIVPSACWGRESCAHYDQFG